MDASSSTETPGNGPPRRRRRGARAAADEALVAAQQPIANTQATVAWRCACWGLIPVVGLVLGTAATLLGILGYLRVRRRPEDLGIRHAVGAMVLGPVEIFVNSTGLACIIHGIQLLTE